MKKTILSLSLFLLSLMSLCAQDIEVAQSAETSQEDEIARPVTNVLQLQVGEVRVRDTYLTPQLYTGANLGLRYERWHAWKQPSWVSQQVLSAQLGLPEDRGHHSEEWAGRFDYRYSAHYRMDNMLWQGLTLMAGGMVGLEAGFDYNLAMASANNPATAKVALHVGVSAAAVWHYQMGKHPCSAMLQVQLPLMGYALQPEYGASYYETFLLETAGNAHHFTSLHNRQDLDVRLTTDIAASALPLLRRSGNRVRVGVAYRIETMDINHVVTRYSSLDAVIGLVFDHLKYNRQKTNLLKHPAHEAY